MFSKQDKRPTPTKALPAPMVAETARRGPKVASVISEDLEMSGGMTSEGEVHIDGKVRGDVKVARLTLGEAGVIDGSITAEMVELRGTVNGPITAKVVRLFSSSRVEGDITHDQLAIESGAHFQGRCVKLQLPADPAQEPELVSEVIPLPAPAAVKRG